MKPTPAANAALAEPLRAAFVHRAVETIAQVAARADPKVLSDALAAATGFGAIVRALLQAGDIDGAVTALDPLAPLAARNAAHRHEALAAAGGALSSAQVAERLGVSRQAVDKRRRAHALLAVQIGGDWRYPLCQFDDRTGEAVAGLAKLLGGFRETPPWVVLDFLLAPDDVLGGQSPLQVLRRSGMTPDLERLARIERGDGFA